MFLVCLSAGLGIVNKVCNKTYKVNKQGINVT
jgi:hypothetical protein